MIKAALFKYKWGGHATGYFFFENVLKIHVPEAGTVLFDNPKGETNHHLSVYIKHSAFVFKL